MATTAHSHREVIEVGPLEILPEDHLVRARGRALMLSIRELRLLTELARRADRIMPREELFRELGVYLVTHDRAGYARSDRRRGRCIADEVDDVLFLAGELRFERFAVTGGSGGGPHALACAALIPPERTDPEKETAERVCRRS